VQDARRIRLLAARNLAPEAIAARLKLRPAVVRRVLSRSAIRGAPRKRESSTTLSFVTTPDVAATIRAAAAAQAIPVSGILERIVRAALAHWSGGAASQRLGAGMGPRPTTPPRPRARTPKTRDAEPAKTDRGPENESLPRRPGALRTAADAPESVRRLLKSYDPRALRWRVRAHRYAIVIAILTRGNAKAKEWLRRVLTSSEARALVRSYRGAGCAEPERALLRKELELTEADIPTRPYLGFGEGASG
jgi:hypothetical protein